MCLCISGSGHGGGPAHGVTFSDRLLPHRTRRPVRAAGDGVVWRVELGNPTLTARSGFNAKTAKPGDAIVVLGNRHKSKVHMKAVRITIAGRNYDIYPERIRAATN